jgi:hypothetical protein
VTASAFAIDPALWRCADPDAVATSINIPGIAMPDIACSPHLISSPSTTAK